MIIAITGYKRAGKDSIARFLENELDCTMVEHLADPMKLVAGFLFGIPQDRFEGLKDVVDERYGISPRQFLQVFGTEFMQLMLCEKFPAFAEKIGRTFWVRWVLDKYINKENVLIIPDMRFLHEYDVLKEYVTRTGDQLMTIRVTRPSITPTDPHASEQDIPLIPVDREIINDGTLKDLEAKVRAIYHRNSIYIAGPITGLPALNKPAFDRTKALLEATWDTVVSPFDVSEFEEGKSWEDYMKEDIPAMVQCEAIYLLKGWELSKGAVMEHQIAIQLNMEVIHEEGQN